ncbi:MAG: hypothetical protein NC033_00775 [Clostridiales bacterium]|nr:hypothetical protein [Clostridiales bacterium]
MLNLVNSIVAIVACFILWTILSGLMMLSVRHNGTKKSWKKIKEEYPYFGYRFYKKVFFLGLNDAMPLSVVVLSFIVNISLILTVIFCIWNIILMNIVASIIARVCVGIFIITILIRGLIFIVKGFKI